MRLFMAALRREVVKMHANNIRLRVVGDLDRFSPRPATHQGRRSPHGI
jgi:undecaprenyl diphosphate synthase